MKLFKLLLVSLVLCAGSYSAVAEDLIKTIEVDPVTGQPKEVLPFDEPFILKIKTDIDPEFILLYELRKFSETIDDVKNLHEIPKSNIYRSKEYLLIRFDRFNNDWFKNNAFLKPSRDYIIVIPKADDLLLDLYDEFYQFSTTNDERHLDKAYVIYRKIANNQKKKSKAIFLTEDAALNPEECNSAIEYVNEFYERRKEEVYKVYESVYKVHLYSDVQSYILARNNLKVYRTGGFANTLRNSANLTNTLIFYNRLSKDKSNCLAVSCPDFAVHLELFFSTQDQCFKNVFLGLDTLGGNKCNVALNKDYELYTERLKRLRKTKNQLLAFKKNIERLEFNGLASGISTPITTELNRFIAQAEAVIKNIEDLIQKREKILSLSPFEEYKKVDFLPLRYKDGVKGTTLIFNHEKRAEFQITPEFGWVYSGNTSDFNYFAPYAGFHINFRYIKKRIPLRKLPNFRCYHRFSFMMGYTLTTISEEGKRADFFEKSTMLTGVGFRLSNSVRVVGGINWFNKIDPNPVLNTKSLAVAPYFGVSIDLGIKDLVNGFKGLALNK